MKRKMTDRHRAVAYVLNKEMGYPMGDIGTLMKCSQSTISNAIRDFTTKMAIENLEIQLAEARILLENEYPEIANTPILYLDDNNQI